MKKISFENKINTKIYRVHIQWQQALQLFLATVISGTEAQSAKAMAKVVLPIVSRISCNWVLSGKRGSETDCIYGRVSGGNL